LKYSGQGGYKHEMRVALCVGAWIEMAVLIPFQPIELSPSAWGRGLKFAKADEYKVQIESRPLCGGVD